MPSIRRRLLSILLIAVAGVWLLMAAASYFDTRHEVEELFDAKLAQSARTLLLLSRHELVEVAETGLPGTHVHFMPENLSALPGHPYEHKVSYQIWLVPEGDLLVRADTAPPEPLSDLANGFSNRFIDGEPWRIFSLTDDVAGLKVQLGEHRLVREELTGQIARRLLTPMLIVLPLLGMLIWFGVGRALSPLLRLAGEVSRRAPDRLDPLPDRETPAEARPLVAALNHLFLRLGRAFEHERRFTADAAHELRTPLAALKTQAQVALRTPHKEGRREALQQLVQGVDRATHLVSQLLTLARLDPDKQAARHQALALCPLLTEVLADIAPAALEKDIELELEEPCHGEVLGSREMLTVLMRNLIGNAVHYTPNGGEVKVAVAGVDGTIRLTIDDSGPGIPAAERTRVFERFYRGEGVEQGGCGLGLSIVQRIATLHGAEVALGDSPLGGLRIAVRFPAIHWGGGQGGSRTNAGRDAIEAGGGG